MAVAVIRAFSPLGTIANWLFARGPCGEGWIHASFPGQIRFPWISCWTGCRIFGISGSSGKKICAITGFRFHGKATNDVLFRGGVPDRVAVAEDRRELTSRLDYLKRKFVRLLSDRERSLVVYKIKTSDCVPGVSEKVERLRKCLDGFGGCYDLLIVCERGNESVFGDDPGFELRCVDRFNPDSDVTNARLGDPLGWRLLFTEFAPRVTVKRKDKKFKFQ